LSYTYPSNSSNKKTGNNTLFLIAGALTIILIVLIFWGNSNESSVDQLVQSAAPDSSAFASQELVSPVEIENSEIEEPVKEEPKAAIIPIADSAIQTSTEADQNIDTSAQIPKIEKPRTEESGDGKIYFYKIKKGDTMYKIAAKFGNKPADVMALNGLTDMSVQADKEIKLKIKGIHNVGEGEGLNAIAEKYSIPGKSILIANGLNSEALKAGVQLVIPLK
jgi:LysM repeat protein